MTARYQSSILCRRVLRGLVLGPLIAVFLTVSVGTSLAGNRDTSSWLYGDPLEEINRSIFQVNLWIDTLILSPVSAVYLRYTPGPVRRAVFNFTSNLQSPVILVNDLLQGEIERAYVTFTRFSINSTIGFLGINDVATGFGLPAHAEDFGQTLAVWGLPNGPYLVLPAIGPTDVRDGVGGLVDLATDPFKWIMPSTFNLSVSGARVIDARARNFDEINDLKKNSLDFYAALRSLYGQHRARLIANGATSSP